MTSLGRWGANRGLLEQPGRWRLSALQMAAIGVRTDLRLAALLSLLTRGGSAWDVQHHVEPSLLHFTINWVQAVCSLSVLRYLYLNSRAGCAAAPPPLPVSHHALSDRRVARLQQLHLHLANGS